MDASQKLRVIEKLFLQELSQDIVELERNIDKERLKIVFKTGIKIYIQFNNYQEYSYSIIFSDELFDRIRFDNYDEKWVLATNPHHIHPRFEKEAVQSPMNGNPEHDGQHLIKYLKSGLI